MTHRETLTVLLQRGAAVAAPGVYDALGALLVDQAGFEMAFVSGGSVSFARHGRPDLGLVTAQEMADTVALIRDRVDLPLLVDMDTGFGNALNVRRTVRTFETAGASALQMEDQEFPKRCGHMAGKRVISAGEMVGKIHAALDARQHEDTLIVARTDALAVNGFEDALERAHRYREAGADALFIEAPQTREQMETIAKAFPPGVPLVHNLVEGGGSPVPSLADLDALGYRIGLFPVTLLHAFVPRARAVLEILRERGSTASIRDELLDLDRINDLLGADALLEEGRRYDAD